jgi:hypothetical protein
LDFITNFFVLPFCLFGVGPTCPPVKPVSQSYQHTAMILQDRIFCAARCLLNCSLCSMPSQIRNPCPPSRACSLRRGGRAQSEICPQSSVLCDLSSVLCDLSSVVCRLPRALYGHRLALFLQSLQENQRQCLKRHRDLQVTALFECTYRTNGS